MDLRTYLRAVRTYLLLIAAAVVVAAGLAFMVSNASQAVYTADARLVVTAGLGGENTRPDDILAAPRVGQAYAGLAATRPVLQDVISRAGLADEPEALVRRLTVTSDPTTPFLVVSMTDPSPTQAALAANTLADILVELASIPPSDAAAGRELLAVVERAVIPDDPSGPRVMFNSILAAATVLLVALTILSLGGYLRSDWPIREAVRE